MIAFSPSVLETLSGSLAIVTKGRLTSAAKDAFSRLRKFERVNMQKYGYELFEDPVSGVRWLTEVRKLAMAQDPGAGWLWDHPVGDPFEETDIRTLSRLRLFFKRPLGGIEEEEWITASIVERGGAGSGNFGHSGRPGKRGGSASASGGLGKPIATLQGANIYKADRLKGSLPSTLDFGLALVLDEGKGDVYYASFMPDITDRWDAPTHAEVANAAGISNKDYDGAVRLEIELEGDIVARVQTSGVTSIPSHYWTNEEMFREIDSYASSNIQRAAKGLRYLGVSGDTPFVVQMMSGYRDEGALSEWKALLQITKGGSGSGNYGHRGWPGKRGGSSSGRSGGRSRGTKQSNSQPTRGRRSDRDKTGRRRTKRTRERVATRSEPVRTPFGGWHDVTVQAAFKHRFDQTIEAIMTTDVNKLSPWQKRNTQALQDAVASHRRERQADNPGVLD